MRSHPLPGLLVGLPVLLLVLYTLGGLTELGDVGLPTVPFATLLALPIDLWLRDLATAVTAYTAGSARINGHEHVTGHLSPGMLADLVVLDRDIFAAPVEEIADARTIATYVGGDTVYVAEGASS